MLKLCCAAEKKYGDCGRQMNGDAEIFARSESAMRRHCGTHDVTVSPGIP